MKLADLMNAVDQSFPNYEFEIEREGEASVTLVFRNILRLDADRRAEVMEFKAEAAEGDSLRKQAEAEKAGLTLLLDEPERIEEIEEVFQAVPNDRDALWIELGRLYSEETQLGEAQPSQ